MADDWAKATARKVEGRVAEEAERMATHRKRFEEGVERFRRQLLDLVEAVNRNIEAENHRLHTIVLDNGLILSAAYKRVVTVEEPGVVPGVPACVGRVVIERENRRATQPAEPTEVYITAAGSQTAFYQRTGTKDLKPLVEADFRQLVEYFGT